MRSVFLEHPFSVVKMVIFVEGHHIKFTIKSKPKRLRNIIFLAFRCLINDLQISSVLILCTHRIRFFGGTGIRKMLKRNHLQNYPRCDSNAQPLAPEANAKKSYIQQNQQLTKTENPVFDTSLDKILQKHPDLTALVEAWPVLPEHIRQAIKALVQTHKAETK